VRRDWPSSGGAGTGEATREGSFHLNPVWERKADLLRWSLIFLIVAIVAAALGLTVMAGTAAGIARLLFLVFFVLLVASAVAGAFHGRPPL
jgi:uncharacterized membrane protein YtjA (UPF0391 family)